VCGLQLVPDLQRPPAGRGCSVDTDHYSSRDIRYFPASVSFISLSLASCPPFVFSCKYVFVSEVITSCLPVLHASHQQKMLVKSSLAIMLSTGMVWNCSVWLYQRNDTR